MKNKLGLAIAIASDVFKHKTDKGGKPYILHCLRVMNGVAPDEELMTIGILHDVVEDSFGAWTIEKLREEGFSERILRAVDLLTHRPEMSYDDYIRLIATNNDARLVKMADLRDNSDITRIKDLRKKDFDRLEKYHRNYKYLEL